MLFLMEKPDQGYIIRTKNLKRSRFFRFSNFFWYAFLEVLGGSLGSGEVWEGSGNTWGPSFLMNILKFMIFDYTIFHKKVKILTKSVKLNRN